MQLPFTAEQFYAVLRDDNNARWPAQALLLALAVAAVAAVAAAGLAALASKRWTVCIGALTRALEAARHDGTVRPAYPTHYDAHELEGLPAPVQRYFRERGVRWEAVDDSSAHATFTDGALTLKLLFRFNAVGLIDTVHAEARGRAVDGKTVSSSYEFANPRVR